MRAGTHAGQEGHPHPGGHLRLHVLLQSRRGGLCHVLFLLGGSGPLCWPLASGSIESLRLPTELHAVWVRLPEAHSLSNRQLGWHKDSEEPSLPVNGWCGASPQPQGWGAVGREAGSPQG